MMRDMKKNYDIYFFQLLVEKQFENICRFGLC